MNDQTRDMEGAAAPEPVVSVRGEVTTEVPPEIARLWVTVRAEDRDRRAALEKLSRRNGEFLSLVSSYGDAVERAETGQVEPVHDDPAGRPGSLRRCRAGRGRQGPWE